MAKSNWDILAGGGKKCVVCGKWTEKGYIGLFSSCKYCNEGRKRTIETSRLR